MRLNISPHGMNQQDVRNSLRYHSILIRTLRFPSIPVSAHQTLDLQATYQIYIRGT